MFDHQDPDILWVASNTIDGNGTYENPFEKIEQALKRVQPGGTIVLKEGIYENDVTIQISGKASQPVRITADTDAEVEIRNSCWFFYDTSDLIISGLIFSNEKSGSVSVMGSCKRNRFENLHFIYRSDESKASCALFFGGAGGECNVVENCSFKNKSKIRNSISAENASVGIMISEGDPENSQPLKNHLIRRNQFYNFGYSILIGSNQTTVQSGHIIEYNTIDKSTLDGILVKCGDTVVRGNLIRNCMRNSISVISGNGSIIEENRVVDCRSGIVIHGSGHTVENNCIIRCSNEAIRAGADNTVEDLKAANNLFVEKNSFIDCGCAETKKVAGIRIESGSICIIQQNLIYGKGIPYLICSNVSDNNHKHCPQEYSNNIINDNIVSGTCEELKGTTTKEISFPNQNQDNFENSSEYGCQGWMLKPEAFDPQKDLFDDEHDYLESSVIESEDGNLILPGEYNEEELFDKFFTESTNNEEFFYEEN